MLENRKQYDVHILTISTPSCPSSSSGRRVLFLHHNCLHENLSKRGNCTDRPDWYFVRSTHHEPRLGASSRSCREASICLASTTRLESQPGELKSAHRKTQIANGRAVKIIASRRYLALFQESRTGTRAALTGRGYRG